MKSNGMNEIKNEVFIFRYDPNFSFEGMFKEFWDAVDGKKQSVEPHVVRSDSIEALSTNMNKNRLEMFSTLVEKKPVSLTDLARLLQKDYTVVRRDARILEGMGLIKLERTVKEVLNKNNGGKSSVKFKEVKPVALYKRIIFDFPTQETQIKQELKEKQSDEAGGKSEQIRYQLSKLEYLVKRKVEESEKKLAGKGKPQEVIQFLKSLNAKLEKEV